MIQANELRVGNWVLNPDKQKCVIKEISAIGTVCVNNLDFWKEDNNFGYSTNEIIPIPLTEEILLKCGFENTHGLFTKEDLTPVYLRKPFLEADFYHVKTISGDKLTSIKYLHQLQNVYFALTGQELTINF